jgi:hypothetical protein
MEKTVELVLTEYERRAADEARLMHADPRRVRQALSMNS